MSTSTPRQHAGGSDVPMGDLLISAVASSCIRPDKDGYCPKPGDTIPQAKISRIARKLEKIHGLVDTVKMSSYFTFGVSSDGLHMEARFNDQLTTRTKIRDDEPFSFDFRAHPDSDKFVDICKLDGVQPYSINHSVKLCDGVLVGCSLARFVLAAFDGRCHSENFENHELCADGGVHLFVIWGGRDGSMFGTFIDKSLVRSGLRSYHRRFKGKTRVYRVSSGLDLLSGIDKIVTSVIYESGCVPFAVEFDNDQINSGVLYMKEFLGDKTKLPGYRAV